jgi:hypothetical protein
MKKKILFSISTLVCLMVALWPSPNAHSNGGGAPVGYTGSPLEFSGRTCSISGCHAGAATTPQSGWVTSTVPACGYTPGQTYSISVFVTSPGRTKFGFSASPQKSEAEKNWLNVMDSQKNFTKEWKNVVDAINKKTITSIDQVRKHYKVSKEVEGKINELLNYQPA